MNRTFAAVRKLGLHAGGSLPEMELKFRWHWPVLILSVAYATYTAVARGQDCTWDVLNYHFYTGFAFLHKPLNFDFAPAQVQSFFNPLIHVFSYILLAHLPSRLVAALLGAIQGLNIYIVFQISQLLFGHWANPSRFLISLCNAAAACYGAIFFLELGTTFGDSLNSILILCGLLLILRYLQSEATKPSAPDYLLAIAGFMIGAAVGLKLTSAICAAGIAIAVLILSPSSIRRLRPLLVLGAFMGVGFVAAYGIWGYNLYRQYGNPIYPYMNTIFRSPFFDLSNLSDTRFFPRTWQQKLFYPFFFIRRNTYVSEIQFRDMRFALCYIAAVSMAAAGLFRLLRKPGRVEGEPAAEQSRRSLIFLTLFFAVSYAAWQYQFSVYRYLIVLELLAPVFLSRVLAYFLKENSRVWMVSLLLNVAICVRTVPADFGHQRFDDQFLKIGVPCIGDLEQSVVLMGGLEPNSYIIPYFPASTRFVRISSNFIRPGQNAGIDRRIREILAQYDAGHVFVHVSSYQQMERLHQEAGFYGVNFDELSCRPVLSRAGEGGYLCRTGTASVPEPSISGEPEFQELAAVRLDAGPKIVEDYETIFLSLRGLNLKTMDVLYTINGKRNPPQRKCYLDKNQKTGIPIDPAAPRGLYHFIGIKDSAASDSNRWIRVDARVLVR